jgi:hypothetical protein
MTGLATGSFNGTSFTSQPFDIVVTGDTTARTGTGPAYTLNTTGATVSVNGFASADFTDSTSMFINGPWVFNDASRGTLFEGIAAGWDLISPVTSTGFFLFSQNGTQFNNVPTTQGGVTITGLSNTKMTASLQQAAIFTLQGGSSSNPAPLPGGSVGAVSGTIGTLGTQDFYTFLWGGGFFSASASVTGASTGASYLFSEGAAGSCNGQTTTLDGSNGFASTIAINNLAAGTYCIGITATSALDPAFTLNFNTPVSGVPEPSVFGLLSIGLGMIGILRFTKFARTAHA